MHLQVREAFVRVQVMSLWAATDWEWLTQYTTQRPEFWLLACSNGVQELTRGVRNQIEGLIRYCSTNPHTFSAAQIVYRGLNFHGLWHA